MRKMHSRVPESCLRLAIVLTLAPHGFAVSSEPAFTVPAGRRQLFLDDYGIARIENLKRTMHQPRKKGAVIRPNFANGETSIQTRSGPAWDEERQVFKLWLISPACYESRDGLHWTKTKPQPSVEVINAVIDPDDPAPNRRYKGLVSVLGGREPVVSPDGIHWKRLEVSRIPSSDESNLSYDRVTRTFIATVKHRGPYGRTVWLSTSKDFETWTKPELIFHPDERDQELARANIKARLANPTLQPMFDIDPDTYNVQVYNMGVFRYEGLYLGMPAMFHSTGPRPNYPNTDGFHLIQLVCSRDLRTWKRLGDRQPFIGPSPVGAGAYDLTQILPPSRPVVRGDELWFYYTGIKYRAGTTYVGKYPNGKFVPQPGLDRDTGAICLAVLRRDGFISLDAGKQSGTLLTQPFQLPNGNLFVNVDALGGELRVEALDSSGEVQATSAALEGDRTSGEISWKEGSFADLKGKTVSLRFRLRNASFYSYWSGDPADDRRHQASQRVGSRQPVQGNHQ